MKQLLSILILSLTYGLCSSCGNDMPENSGVGMTWESKQALTLGQDIPVPTSGGVYDFTCTSHATFGIRQLWDGEESSSGDLSSTLLQTASKAWYEIRIEANRMQVKILPNETDKPRTLHIRVGSGGGGSAEFGFIQTP